MGIAVRNMFKLHVHSPVITVRWFRNRTPIVNSQLIESSSTSHHKGCVSDIWNAHTIHKRCHPLPHM